MCQLVKKLCAFLAGVKICYKYSAISSFALFTKRILLKRSKLGDIVAEKLFLVMFPGWLK